MWCWPMRKKRCITASNQYVRGFEPASQTKNQHVGSTDSALARLRLSVIRKVSMVVPSQPWQGAPAARAPLHPHRQTGLSESPSACPDACDAGRGNAFGDRRSRCNVWPLDHQSGGAFLLPRHPHDQGETSLSPGPHRPTLCGLDAHHRSRRWSASRGVPAPCNPALANREIDSSPSKGYYSRMREVLRFIICLTVILGFTGSSVALAFVPCPMMSHSQTAQMPDMPDCNMGKTKSDSGSKQSKGVKPNCMMMAGCNMALEIRDRDVTLRELPVISTPQFWPIASVLAGRAITPEPEPPSILT